MKKDQPQLSQEELAKAERIAYLVFLYIRKEISQPEQIELDNWIAESDDHVLLFEDLIEEDNLEDMKNRISKTDASGALKRLENKISQKPAAGSRRRRTILLYLTAAAFTGVVLSLYFIPRAHNSAIATQVAGAPDIAPGGNKAILTLQDESTILLDTIPPGAQIDLGKSKIVKTDSGKLAYSSTGNESTGEPIGLNTLTTPVGGQYRLALPDGTQVYLNSSSSIKFPIAFSGKERTVELKGEGYFEVSKNDSQPFHVKVNGADIEVVGTHFNINAYPDEGQVKTTLLEGSVKISLKDKPAILLKPGESASWGTDNKININPRVNEEDIIGWKNGLFSFHREDIRVVMRQVARWYDVKIQYNGEIKNHFNAAIERNVPVSRLLQLLTETGDAHFEIKDKTIVVNP